MRLLTDIDADEISPVHRAANKRRFLLLKSEGENGMQLDTELADVLAIPAEREGALLDHLRKEGASESEQRAAIAALRLIEGFPEITREVLKARSAADDDSDEGNEPDADEDDVAKMLATPEGSGEYGYSGHPVGGLTGRGSGAKKDGRGKGAAKDGSGSGADTDGEDNSDEDLEGEAPGQTALNKANKEPYGDVTYADPGYQSDGQKRYPIDTEEHIRAAWSYINQAGNASKYSSENLARVKSRISAAMKRIGATVNKEEHDMSEGTVPVRKEDGSWDLSSLAPEAQEFWADVRKAEDEMRERVEKAEALAAKAEDELRTKEFILKSESLAHVAPSGDLAPLLKEAAETMKPESFEKLEKILKAVDARIATGDLYTEFGSAARSEGAAATDAYAQIEKMASELVEKSTDLTRDQAVDRVLATPEGKRLYSEYTASAMGVAGGVA